MAAKTPGKLKNVDVARFVKRAAQLEKIKPVISYWCEYHIVGQILSKNLATVDDECRTYTTGLMDKLERTKTAFADNDAVTDDVAAQAYVEQFALETFQRAENAVQMNKASAQTADTYQAAATFLDLLGIWQQPLEAEAASKSKYAKYHALRIVKAIKAGEDPNLSNPSFQSSAQQEALPELSPDDPEVQRIKNANFQPTVEDAPENFQPPPFAPSPLAPTSVAQSPPIPPPPPAPEAHHASEAHQHPPGDVSPLSPAPGSRTESIGSAAGAYFPRVPAFTSESATPNPPAPAPDQSMEMPDIEAKNFYQQQSSTPFQHQPPGPFQQQTSPYPQPSPNPFQQPSPLYQQHPPPPNPYQPLAPLPVSMSPAPFAAPPPSHSIPAPIPEPVHIPPGAYRTDDEAMAQAQKHAKWAISALNFEDVPTAVKELKIALRALGAS